MLSMRVRNLSKSVLLVIKGTVIPDSWHHHAFFLALKPIFMFQGCFKEVLDYVLSFSGQFLAIYLPFILIQVLFALKRDNIPSNDQFICETLDVSGSICCRIRADWILLLRMSPLKASCWNKTSTANMCTNIRCWIQKWKKLQKSEKTVCIIAHLQYVLVHIFLDSYVYVLYYTRFD